jgi:hypothetical protein
MPVRGCNPITSLVERERERGWRRGGWWRAGDGVVKEVVGLSLYK